MDLQTTRLARLNTIKFFPTRFDPIEPAHLAGTQRGTTLIRDLPSETPAFVFDLPGIKATAQKLARLALQLDVKALYAVKALSIAEVVTTIAEQLDGLAVSSLDEAHLARAALDALDGPRRTLQFTSPGLRGDEVEALAASCDALVFNSLPQWRRYAHKTAGLEQGLRVNPQLTCVDDPRCDPCRPHSKLGVPMLQLAEAFAARANEFGGLAGLHFHTNYRARDTRPLAATIAAVMQELGPLLKHVDWLNLGGGYEFTEMRDDDLAPLAQSLDVLRSKHHLQVLIEPGSALVRRHGYLVATVVDMFESDGRTIAVLDTSVAHLAEVFEYQRPPEICDSVPEGPFSYELAGASCLAGDLFGRHAFVTPLSVGTRIVLKNVGAYAHSKVQHFNGLRPPAVCLLSNQDCATPRRPAVHSK